MTAETLLANLSARGVVVTLAGDSIELDAPAGVLTDDDVLVLRDRKSKIVDLIVAQCRPHNNPNNYIDAPAIARPGWIRTTCRVCGRFVGYRCHMK